MKFLMDETPIELPIFVTTTTLRELLDMQKGETLEDALARPEIEQGDFVKRK